MTAIKKIAATGLVIALSIPTAVYGAEQTGYSQPIKDTKQQQIGVFSCEKNTEEWTKEVVLKASAVPDDGKVLPEFSFLWQNEQNTGVSSGESYTVTDNGLYTVKLKSTENSGAAADDIQIDVQNIDTTGPEMIHVAKDTSEWTSGPVKVTVECEDYQPDAASSTMAENVSETESVERTYGSGLHPEGAYSFDGGKTWTKDNFITIEENTTIDFIVRDALGHETKQNITVDNIDKSEPHGRVSIADGGVLYEGEGGSLVLTASASDASSGLADQPYSWDGGISWTNVAMYTVTEAGNYTVFVRDKAGNYTQATLQVNYTQRPENNNGESSGGSGNTQNTGGNGSNGSTNTSAGNGNGNVYYGVPAAPMTGNYSDDGSNTSGVTVPRETRENSESESRESVNKKETRSKNDDSEPLKTPLIPKDETSGFPIRWVLIVIAAVAVILGAIVAAKIISDRQAAAGQDDDDDDEDMRQIYARVSKEENKVLSAMKEESDRAAAAAITGAVVTEEIIPEETPLIDEEPPENVVTSETIELPTEEPEIPAVEPEAAEEMPVEEPEIPAVEPEAAEEMPVEEPEIPAVEPEIPVVEPETPVTEPEASAKEPEPVVLEGAHSRLIYDPATGEYKYEFK